MLDLGIRPSLSLGSRRRTFCSNRSAQATSRLRIPNPIATTSSPGPGSGIKITPRIVTNVPDAIRKSLVMTPLRASSRVSSRCPVSNSASIAASSKRLSGWSTEDSVLGWGSVMLIGVDLVWSMGFSESSARSMGEGLCQRGR